ncbi:MAG: RNA-guided endonuclease TnpB family protein [Erysipelotrichaceae bacterium]|nr:RNA-guided endonuclease TnpB family protein [Erysipelotrichaceae bacterium]
MNKAIKYRLYPTTEQAVIFSKTFGCCRKIWNLMLSDKINSYELTGTFERQTPAMYKKEYPYLKEVDSLALSNVQLNLESAIRNCFDRKRKIRNGFPVYKSSKHSRKSYTTNYVYNNIRLGENYINLPKVKKVSAVIHRLPDPDWKLKSVTVSQDSDGKYYASVLFEYEDINSNHIPDITNAIGLDYKSDGLYMDSNGNIGSDHKYYRESHSKLSKEQRKLSRMKGSKKGETKSNNYLKQSKKVNRIHTHTSNQRKDNLHKLSTKIANSYDVVCVESLDMKNISNKDFGNGKATMDNGYGMFINFLEYKMADRGKYLVKVDRYYPSSQICSCCGRKHKLKLTDRIYKCECGAVMDRDYNAAINILNEGLRLLKETD